MKKYCACFNPSTPSCIGQTHQMKGTTNLVWRRTTMIGALIVMMAVQSTCQAFWKELWGGACTVVGSVSAEVGIGVALIGVQAVIFKSSIAANPNTGGNPEPTPTEFAGTVPMPPPAAVADAMLALMPPDVTPSGTPEEVDFIQACNVVLGLGRSLQNQTNPAVIQSVLTQMSAALENAANAYDATGLNQAITQSDIDNFKAACASNTPPARENDYLISCGLTQAQLQALTSRLSTEPMTLTGASLSVSTMLHRAAQLLDQSAVAYAGMTHAPLANAILTGSSNFLVVSNLGSSGQDGVSIAMPSNLSGLDVGWLSFDESNTVPVGAFIQEQMIGPANGLSNTAWGTLTQTKNGTSNYVLSVDYSVLGASNYTVQAFLKGTMVGQATNQPGASLAVCGDWGSTFDWELWPNFGPTIDWGSGTPVLLGGAGAAITCDLLYIVPENVTITDTPTLMQITASQVPSLTITSEIASVVYQGLTNSSLGNAAITEQGNQLAVYNLGSSGQDGVSIALPSNLLGLDAVMQPLDVSNSLPVGAYVQERVIGTAGTVANGALGTVTVTKIGGQTFPYRLSADYSPIGASNYTVQAYLNGIMVAQATNQPGASLASCSTISASWDIELWPRIFYPTTDWDGPTTLLIAGVNVTCDQLFIIPEGVAITIPPTAMQITASQMPAMNITKENLSLPFQGFTNTSMGNAFIANQLDHGSNRADLVISNIGSSGQDGVSIALSSTLSGVDVGWLSFDESNTVPVGAFIQEQMTGPANGLANTTWGTLTLSKSSSSNFVLSANYSPVGASNYTVQAFLKGALVGQATNQPGASLAVCSSWGSTFDWEFWPRFGPTIDWGDGTPILLGGAAITCDRLYIVPQNVTITGAPTAMQITASQVPTLTITSEIASTVYQGVTNTSLGTCILANQLDHGSNTLSLANLGSSGQDGVEITMPDNLTALEVHWQNLDASNTLPVGAYLQQQMVGSAGSVSNGALGTVTLTKTGDPVYPYTVSADYSAIGTTTYTVQAYLNKVLVGQATGQNGASLAQAGSCSSSWDWEIWPNFGPTIDFGGVGVPLLVGGALVMCDQIQVIPENVTWSSRPTSMQITASQVPAITITSENVSMMYDGLTNTSLGSSSMVFWGFKVSSNQLVIGNIGSSGQDGVEVALNPGNNFAGTWLPLDPNNSMQTGAYVKSQMIGTAGSVTNDVLGSLTCTKVGTSNYTITVDYSPLGSSTHTVQVYNGATLVAQLPGQLGAACAIVHLPPGTCTINPFLNQEWPTATSISLVGGPTVTGTEILVVPEGGTSVSSISAARILAANISSIVLTNESVSVTYSGLTHTPVGSAYLANQLDHGSNTLTVANLGSSGQDGVLVAIPSNLTHWDAHWADLDAAGTLPVGSYISQQVIGSAGTVANGVLQTSQVTKAGANNYVITADLSPLGASTRTVQVFNGSNLVAQVTGQSGSICATSSHSPGSSSLEVVCCPFRIYDDWDFGTLATLSISGGPEVVGDRLVVIPEGGANVSLPVSVQFTASQIPSFTITSEDVTLTYGGLAATALGNASISAVSGPLTVANIGSSGQDGVSLALPANPPGLDFVWQQLDLSNTLPVGAYIRQQIAGTMNGVNGVLGITTMTKECAVCNGSNYVISADFSPVGAGRYTVQAYRNGVLVAQATGQPGNALASCPIWGDSGCIPQPPILKGGWDWPEPPPFLNIAGSPPVQADHLFITPQNVVGSATLSALQITASQVPSLSLTAVTPSPFRVSLSQTAQNRTLQWFGTGILQTSTDLKTWTDLPSAVSPYVLPTSPKQGFYRIRQPVGN